MTPDVRPDDRLTPERWPGGARNPGEADSPRAVYVPPYGPPRVGPWSRWKAPGAAPDKPGAA